MPMQLPTPRVREVLSVLGDLNPTEARALLSEVVATLDAAELYALRTLLPPQATKLLPAAAGAATVMNTDPMPWEFVAPVKVDVASKGPSTQELLAAIGPTSKKPWAVSAVAIALTAATVWLAWPSSAPSSVEPDELVALPPRAAALDPAPGTVAPAPTPSPAAPATKPLPPKRARAAAPKEKKLGPNEWASPFERRH